MAFRQLNFEVDSVAPATWDRVGTPALQITFLGDAIQGLITLSVGGSAAGGDGALVVTNGSNFSGRIESALLTANRTHELPDEDGTFALTSDFVFDPNSVAWVSWVRASDIAGSDGASITSITPNIANGSGNYSGTGTLRTGANGINNLNALSFNGSSNSYSSATGGASLTGDFYAACVVQFSALGTWRGLLGWGDATVFESRTLLKYDTLNIMTFANAGGDVVGTTNLAVATATPYFIEAQSQGGIVTVSVNGLIYARGILTSAAAYTNTAILAGTDVFSDRFQGLMAEWFFLGSALTETQTIGIQNYVSARYGITMGAFGFSGQVLTGGTGASFTKKAAFPVQGNVSSFANGQEHMLSNEWANENTLSIWNKAINGFSAMRTLFYSGEECGAFGTGQIEPFGNVTNGGAFIGTADFRTQSRYGELSIVQSKVTGTLNALRFRLYENGDQIFYRQDGTTPILSMLQSGTPGARVAIGSGVIMPIVAKTTSYSITSQDYTVELTSGTATFTLPTAVGISGQVFNLKNTGGILTAATTSAQTIDGLTTQPVAAGNNLQVQSNGANWIIL